MDLEDLLPVIVVIAIYGIGVWLWGDSGWPLTVIANFLGDLGFGSGTEGGYPWEAKAASA